MMTGWSFPQYTALRQLLITSRLRLPTKSMCVIDPEWNNNVKFESKMTLADHKAMNDFLNATTAKSREPGRVHMGYEHIYERDSFRPLSKLGQQVLPKALQQHQSRHREPKIRITHENAKGKNPVRKAAIVKVNVDNLHIFNPRHNYDCRISINLEVNLLGRTDLADFESLISHDDKGTPQVDRIKDRLSYKHLAYSIDLTKVVTGDLASYELELEVDSNVLREQMGNIKQRKPDAYGDVVSGFVDNAVFLMRQVPESK